MEIFNRMGDLGDSAWFSIMIHMGRITVEFGKHVPGTTLRQRYEINPGQAERATYPLIGFAINEVREQFLEYCRRWEAGEIDVQTR